jgi:hypothetical protein
MFTISVALSVNISQIKLERPTLVSLLFKAVDLLFQQFPPSLKIPPRPNIPTRIRKIIPKDLCIILYLK